MQIRFIRSLLFAVVIVIVLLSMSVTAVAQVSIGVIVTVAPPPLPIYDQPLCPGENYIWTPGYWAYGDDLDDYYWVPGTWVLAPEVGFLWTPGYWEWNDDRYIFNDGYWGPQVGFYGGIFYGFGYFGEGYEGGRWDRDRFYYNTAVNNVNVTVIHNVYNTPPRVNADAPRVSYHGGNGGINRPPKPEELAAARQRHIPPVPVQREHVQVARTNPELRASVNMGKPPVAATPKPGGIKERGVVPAKASGGPYTPPPNRGKNQAGGNAPANRPDNRPGNSNRPENNASRPSPPVHPRDLPRAERPSPPNTGNAKQDQKYQQQQEKQFAKQEQERQKLQQKQDREDQRAAQQKDEARKQQVEQRHQQQTQQLQQKHEQQQRRTQEKQQPRQQQQKQPPPDRNKPPN